MSALTANGSLLPFGVNRAGLFAVIVTCAALTNADTLDVTLPDGVAKDSLPVGPPLAYALSGDVYTADADIGVLVTTHNRATGVTRLTPTGNVAAGSKLLLLYAGTG
jgi:hypothetical protein